jgi:siroheme synthase (precorrin-2 oxidase/ferrochelatase)
LAQRVRRELETQYGPEYAGWVEELGEARKQILVRDPDVARRRSKLHTMARKEAFQAKQRVKSRTGETVHER